MAPIGDNIVLMMKAHANSGSLVMVVSPAYISVFIGIVVIRRLCY